MRLDPFSDYYSLDPAATWRRLLSTAAPVTFDAQLGVWLIAGHDNVRTVLADVARFSNASTVFPLTPLTAAAQQVLAEIDAPRVAVTADPPQHLRTRAILRSLFATTAVRAQDQWGALVTARVDALVAELPPHGDFDLTSFAAQLPLLVILDVLGLPADRARQVHRWVGDFGRIVWGNPTPDEQLAYAHSCLELWRYCEAEVTDRAESGEFGPGLIGDLLRYRNGVDANLTVAEVAALALYIVGAGSETTAGALGHALDHALADPQRWALLAGDEHYLSLHVEETLRHSPAVDGWLRQTETDVILDGVRIPAGARCLVLIGTANHDPAVYEEAHVFEPYRPRAGQHLAFGSGPHYCIGAALARLELTTALRALGRSMPDLARADGYRRQFKPSAALRQHTTLPVQRPAAGRCPVAHDHGAGGSR
ncbi:cytochrome P450 [Actinoplanes sp. NPDC051411]|uniref:cytochrome P450 n=1 Tax=Actinoplanes sp. NPDC051411 TaxID=3155522 RepID=UPI003446651F